MYGNKNLIFYEHHEYLKSPITVPHNSDSNNLIKDNVLSCLKDIKSIWSFAKRLFSNAYFYSFHLQGKHRTIHQNVRESSDSDQFLYQFPSIPAIQYNLAEITFRVKKVSNTLFSFNTMSSRLNGMPTIIIKQFCSELAPILIYLFLISYDEHI